MAAKRIRVRSESSKQAQSEKMKAKWADPAYKAKSVEAFSKRRNIWNDPERAPELREAARIRMTERMKSEDVRAQSAAHMSEFNKTRRAKDLRSISSAANWKNEVLRDRMLSGMVATKAQHLQNETPTEFEARCYAFLDECGAEYEKQRPVLEAYTIPDAYVPSLKLCIYFDSEYWHSMPFNAQRDERQRAQLRELGYMVMVIRCDHKAREIYQHDLDAIRSVLCRAC